MTYQMVGKTSSAVVLKADKTSSLLVCGALMFFSFAYFQRLQNWISANKTNHAIHWIVIYPVDSVIHTLNNRAVKFTKLFSTLITIFHMNKVSCFVFKVKSIESSMEGQRGFLGFRSRNGSKLPNFSP